MILVVESRDVFKKLTTSSFLLLTALCLLFSTDVASAEPATYGANIGKWKFREPVDSIFGTYLTVPTTIADHPPILATIWEISGGSFSVVAWPPKHCSAVHVFFIDAKNKGSNQVVHVQKDWVNSPSIKFYPQIGRIDISEQVNITTETTMNNQKSSVYFENVDQSHYILEVSQQYSDKIEKFEADKTKKQFKFDLTSRVALVLTNSRFCFAHVTRDAGQNDKYIAFFHPNTYVDQTKLPMNLVTYDVPTGVPSLFRPLVNVVPDPNDKNQARNKVPKIGAKSVDLLPVIKVPKMRKPRKEECHAFPVANGNKNEQQSDKITVDSWVGGRNNAQAPKRNEIITLQIGDQCSWVRIWITAKGNQMDKYDQMKLDETIDIFFDQQFFVGPDSDEARPLAGNSSQIGTIHLKRHKPDNYDGKERVVEMSYGRQMETFPYIEYFHMPSMHEESFTINLIRAPKCQAFLTTVGKQPRMQSVNLAPVNSIKLSDCKHFMLDNENEDELG